MLNMIIGKARGGMSLRAVRLAQLMGINPDHMVYTKSHRPGLPCDDPCPTCKLAMTGKCVKGIL